MGIYQICFGWQRKENISSRRTSSRNLINIHARKMKHAACYMLSNNETFDKHKHKFYLRARILRWIRIDKTIVVQWNHNIVLLNRLILVNVNDRVHCMPRHMPSRIQLYGRDPWQMDSFTDVWAYIRPFLKNPISPNLIHPTIGKTPPAYVDQYDSD